MTPHQLNLYIEDYNARKKVENEEKITLVWLGAYWQRVKRMPSLANALKDLNAEPKREMTPEEMLEEIKRLNAQYGGNTY
jgi:leucyl aminopeptidase